MAHVTGGNFIRHQGFIPPSDTSAHVQRSQSPSGGTHDYVEIKGKKIAAEVYDASMAHLARRHQQGQVFPYRQSKEPILPVILPKSGETVLLGTTPETKDFTQSQLQELQKNFNTIMAHFENLPGRRNSSP